MDLIKVVIAEDHKLVRCGIKLLLGSDPNISVIAEVVCGTQVLEFLKKNDLPDLVITDFHMPDTFAINHIYDGGKYISANLSHQLFLRPLPAALKPGSATTNLEFNSREIEVLELISQGMTNSEMGEKVECRNSAELVKFAVKNGLI